MRRAHSRIVFAALLAAVSLAAGAVAEEGRWLPGKWMFQVMVRKADSSTTKIVAVLEPQETKSLLAPDGTKVEWFTVGNAVRIAQAFEREGLLGDRALAETIVGMVGAENEVPGGKVPGKLDTGDPCLTLRMPDGGVVHVGSRRLRASDEPALPACGNNAGRRYLLHPADGGRIVHWSVDQAMRIKDELLASGYSLEDVMRVWVGMRWPSNEGGVLPAITIEQGPDRVEPASICRMAPECSEDADCDALCGIGQGMCKHSRCPVRVCRCR